jgi:hypothetical protein
VQTRLVSLWGSEALLDLLVKDLPQGLSILILVNELLIKTLNIALGVHHVRGNAVDGALSIAGVCFLDHVEVNPNLLPQHAALLSGESLPCLPGPNALVLLDFDIYDDRFVGDDDAALLGHPCESLGRGSSLGRRSRPGIHRRSLATLDELIGILLVTEGSLQHPHVELAGIALRIRLWALTLRQDHIRRVSPPDIIPARDLI